MNDYDLSGKEVVPFCTFGSGGLESSMADMKQAQPNMPPAGELKVYVNVVGDEAPVFTRVVR